MGLSNNQILLRLFIVMAFMVMLPGALLFALGLDPATFTRRVEPDNSLVIEERALAIAEHEYHGKWTEVQETRTTMGELGAVECTSLGTLVSTVVNFVRGNLNWCDSRTEVWVLDFKGEFRVNGAVAPTLSVVLDGHGKLVRVGTNTEMQGAK
jgi:hypothetical protein